MFEDTKTNTTMDVPLAQQVSDIKSCYLEILSLMLDDPRTLAAIPRLNDLCQVGAISPAEVSSNFRRRDATSLAEMAEYSERSLKALADYNQASETKQKDIVKTTRAALGLLEELKLSPRAVDYIASELISSSEHEIFSWRDRYKDLSSTVSILIEKLAPIIEMMVKTTLKEIPLSRRNGFKDDLIQEGALSAYRAIHGFNPEHSSDFKSYLKICVQNSCRDFYRYNKLSLNIPRHIEISSMSQVYADPSEIDKAQYKNRSTTKYELLTELENSEELDALKSAVSRLRPHEQFIIGRFYGLANEPQQSKESLGQGLGLKSSSVGAQIRTIHDRLYYMLSPRFMPEESSE